MSLGHFLIEQLNLYGVDHIFGIPGDYTLNFINEIEKNQHVEYVGVSREDSAGYAADSYARVKGCGAVCVTYSVGAMNVINAIAGAYAERSPVVIITGKPSQEDLITNPNKHHTINNDLTQKEIFSKITCYAITLDSTDIRQNMLMIHTALECMKYNSRPIYIEFSNKDIIRPITRQQYAQVVDFITPPPVASYMTDIEQTITLMLNIMQNAKNRILIVGHEIFRLSLEDDILNLINKCNIPIFTTILGKSTINEYETLSLGCVSQLCSNKKVLNAIHQSDCIISIGMTNTDVDAFTFTPHISINMDEGVTINGKQLATPEFPKMVKRFCEIFRNIIPRQDDKIIENWFSLIGKDKSGMWLPKVDDVPNTLTLEYVFDIIGQKINNDHIVISDIGESLFGMIDIPVEHGQFLSMAYYTSMGFSIPGALGIKYAKPHKRPIIIVGDGSFQMCSTEISSFVKYDMNPIIIILNNKGYSTERAIMDGNFNDIHNWQYEKITSLMCGGTGVYINSPIQFKSNIDTALNENDTLFVFNVQIKQQDMTPAMKMIAEKMCKENL